MVAIQLGENNKTLLNNEYVFNVFVGFVLVGIVVKLFFSDIQEDGSSGPAAGLMWGYTIISLSLIGILFVGITFSDGKPFEKLLGSGLPIMLLLVVMLWAVSFNLKYYDKINKGLVANEYYGWSNVSTTLMIFQIIFITIYIRNSFLVTLKGGTPTQGQKGVIATYFLVLLNTICLGIQQVILEHFTTDG